MTRKNRAAHNITRPVGLIKKLSSSGRSNESFCRITSIAVSDGVAFPIFSRTGSVCSHHSCSACRSRDRPGYLSARQRIIACAASAGIADVQSRGGASGR